MNPKNTQNTQQNENSLYPRFFQTECGRVQIKAISPHKHIILYMLACKDGYERYAELKHRTTEFSEEEVFAKHIASREDNFNSLLRIYALSVLRILKQAGFEQENV